MRSQLLAASLVLLGACATTPAPPNEASAASERDASRESTPAETLASLEARLERADAVDIQFDIESTGAVASHLVGRVRWIEGVKFGLEAQGEFAGQELELALSGTPETLEAFVNDERKWSGERPAALTEAVVVGLIRQGLLHNLAMLSAGQPPDRGDGGVREWLALREPSLGEPAQLGGQDAQPLAFGIEVGGEDVGTGTLWLDARGLPLERHQTVHFPEGDMQVVERYLAFDIDEQ